ncbi:MAG: hypothetical protein BWY87_01430 [Deltaproteobacteria bacterium ADurb.Bin510]|nr:MAG: hypothetical protein BWY87_01430 [Deltaproteobacteria bacterium ADurb.Bin510]
MKSGCATSRLSPKPSSLTATAATCMMARLTASQRPWRQPAHRITAVTSSSRPSSSRSRPAQPESKKCTAEPKHASSPRLAAMMSAAPPQVRPVRRRSDGSSCSSASPNGNRIRKPNRCMPEFLQ